MVPGDAGGIVPGTVLVPHDDLSDLILVAHGRRPAASACGPEAAREEPTRRPRAGTIRRAADAGEDVAE